jgi:hypothetical protein
MLTFVPFVLVVGWVWKAKGFKTAVLVALGWMLVELFVGVLLFDLPR